MTARAYAAEIYRLALLAGDTEEEADRAARRAFAERIDQ